MLLVADRFDGPSNVDTVIGTIHTRIAEAISNMQENKDSITAKVRVNTGPSIGNAVYIISWQQPSTLSTSYSADFTYKSEKERC